MVRLGLAVVVVTLASVSAATSSATPRASGTCSQATARQLIAEHELNAFLLPNPVEQLLCGPFTGPGSQAMVIAIGPMPTCWPVQRWVVFSLTAGAWKLVLDQSEFINPPLVAVGSDIRESAPVFRPGDPRCIPSGGTHTRIWHWDGTRLTAGPWKQVTPGPVRSAAFYSPLPGAISCSMGDDPGRSGVGVYCQSANPQNNPSRQHSVKMSLSGRLTICRGPRCPIGNPGEGTPTLGFGRQMTVGRFRCLSLRSGMKCVVIRSQRGFLFNAAGVTKIA
jgi:hypothetical protein